MSRGTAAPRPCRQWGEEPCAQLSRFPPIRGSSGLLLIPAMQPGAGVGAFPAPFMPQSLAPLCFFSSEYHFEISCPRGFPTPLSPESTCCLQHTQIRNRDVRGLVPTLHPADTPAPKIVAPGQTHRFPPHFPRGSKPRRLRAENKNRLEGRHQLGCTLPLGRQSGWGGVVTHAGPAFPRRGPVRARSGVLCTPKRPDPSGCHGPRGRVLVPAHGLTGWVSGRRALAPGAASRTITEKWVTVLFCFFVFERRKTGCSLHTKVTHCLPS